LDGGYERIFLISVLLMLIFTCLSGEDLDEVERDVIAYWSFNLGTPSCSINKPDILYSDIGNGSIEWLRIAL